MSDYDLIIFDMDGTLVQSEECASRALKDVIPDLTDSVDTVTTRYRGMRLAEIFADIEQRFPGALPDNCLDLYREQEECLSREYIVPSKGAAQMLSQLRTQKCIASNAPVAKTVRSLKICGLSDYFPSGIYSADEIWAWKPDPALFLHAAQQQGATPQRCLVVEDSDVGIQAAESAGMKVIHYQPEDDSIGTQVPVISSLMELFEYVD